MSASFCQSACMSARPVLSLSSFGALSLTPNSCLRRLPRLLAPSIFPSVTCSLRQLLRHAWRIHLPFLCFITIRGDKYYFLESLSYCILHTIGACELHFPPGPHSKTK